MYRCYFTCCGKIVIGENLDAGTLENAIATGHELLMKQPEAEHLDGIEIWQDASFLYTSARHLAA